MATRKNIFITKVLPNVAFAITEDTDESVVLPVSVVRKVKPEVGDHLEAVMVTNKVDPAENRKRAEWFALSATHLDEDAA